MMKVKAKTKVNQKPNPKITKNYKFLNKKSKLKKTATTITIIITIQNRFLQPKTCYPSNPLNAKKVNSLKNPLFPKTSFPKKTNPNNSTSQNTSKTL